MLDAPQTAALLAAVRPTHLLHFAWIVTPGLYWTSPDNFRWVEASLRLLRSFAEHGGRRVVMAGTCAEYDWNYGYCREGVTPLAPATLYGQCKHAMRILSEAFAAQVGLSAAWGRIFFPYGPHEYSSRLVPSVVCSLLRGQTARCSHGHQIRDFLHVQEMADAFTVLLESEAEGAVNVASGQPVALREVIFKIADLLERPDLVELGALPALAAEPPLLVGDVRRLTEEVGWTPQRTLDEGLRDTVNWWRDHFGEAAHDS